MQPFYSLKRIGELKMNRNLYYRQLKGMGKSVFFMPQSTLFMSHNLLVSRIMLLSLSLSLRHLAEYPSHTPARQYTYIYFLSKLSCKKLFEGQKHTDTGILSVRKFESMGLSVERENMCHALTELVLYVRCSSVLIFLFVTI
jgi:hypothetical protein